MHRAEEGGTEEDTWRTGDRRHTRVCVWPRGRGVCEAGLNCSTPQHFPRDQELWVKVNSLGCSRRRWLRSSARCLSTCLGKVRSGFFFVFFFEKQNQTNAAEATKSGRAASHCALSFQPLPAPPSKGSSDSCFSAVGILICSMFAKPFPVPRGQETYSFS